MKADPNKPIAFLHNEIRIGRSIEEKLTETEVLKSPHLVRPRVKGKFLFVGDKKYWIKGVTYGTFSPKENGELFPRSETVRKDFAKMVSNHINTVRLYTPPPSWLLDLGAEYGLRFMVGLPWEQHINFLDSPKRIKNIKDRIREYLSSNAGHPAILAYAIGNEIPASIVRWYGAQRIERFLKELFQLVKKEDPESLVTYVNFPSTEYLQLPFLDLFCFNVYLETQETLSGYLSRLQNLAGDKPLVMAEIGLDSIRNGESKQAEVLQWQVQTAFRKGSAGVFIFSWTDEWYRGGFDILDWNFGVTDRERRPKLALNYLKGTYSKEALSLQQEWPFFSVAICTLNGAKTVQECLDSLFKLNYPNYEVILVSDGSTDHTVQIARNYDCKIIETPNRGLSSARNTAWQAAQGEFVVYIDDDAYADPDWLKFLALSFLDHDFVAVGGPNLPPQGDGLVADCVANAPGGPMQVLITDQEAEHIPGCNMAIRKSTLKEIGGFDPIYRAAGDDVDLCWKILEKGWKIGFNPAAIVWHHRRNKIKTYWKQQKGYGKAEALLEKSWPQKFNFAGHLNWAGRIYAPGLLKPLGAPKSKIDYGIWGTGFFQSLYERDPNQMLYIPLLPEWYLMVFASLFIAMLGFLWSPLLWFFPITGIAFGIILLQAISATSKISFKQDNEIKGFSLWRRFLVTCSLYLIQPLARLMGRLELGLTLWRRRHQGSWAIPASRYFQIWSEKWQGAEGWLQALEHDLKSKGVLVKRGGVYDQWDLEIREGLYVPIRLLMMVEEHGNGRQLLRFRLWPSYNLVKIILFAFTLAIGIVAFWQQAWVAAIIFSGINLGLLYFLFLYSLPLVKSSISSLEQTTE